MNPPAHPIHKCSWCESKGVETYFNSQRGEVITGALLDEYKRNQRGPVSHGICPACMIETLGAASVDKRALLADAEAKEREAWAVLNGLQKAASDYSTNTWNPLFQTCQKLRHEIQTELTNPLRQVTDEN